MALLPALRNAVGKPGGPVRRGHQPHSGFSWTLLTLLPAPILSSSAFLNDRHHCESELQSSVIGKRFGAHQYSMVASDSSNLGEWFQRHEENSIIEAGRPRRIFMDPESQLIACVVKPGTPPASVISKWEWKLQHSWGQVRNFNSSTRVSSPRKMERYSGRVIDRDPAPGLAHRQQRFDENFKRLPVVKKPIAEYRQSIVDNSTKDMALVPKKWKRALPSKEVVDGVMYLKRAKCNPDAVKQVMRKRIARMLKLEMMLVLSELQRLDECALARQVFNAIRRESWYKPNVYLYQTMVQLFGKSKQIKDAVKLFEELQAEGLEPDDSIQRELLRAYVTCGMIPDAVELYKKIQKAGQDKAARSILFHGLNDEEKLSLAAYEKTQGYDWS